MPNYICKLNLDGTERTIKDSNAVRYNESQSLTEAQKTQARSNIGAGTSNFSGNYNDLSNKPTIPSKVSELTNDSGYYSENDTAETALANDDYVPFYDTSASSRKKTLWSNIIDKLKATFAIKSHASTATTYGIATATKYGHTKVIDNLLSTSFTNGEALSAHMGYNLSYLIAGRRVEAGPTYSLDYGYEDMFVYNGILYRYTSTTNAVPGTTQILPGTNCSEVSGGMLGVFAEPRTASVTLVSPLSRYSECSNELTKIGDYCHLDFGATYSSSSSNLYCNSGAACKIGDIPLGFRPKNSYFTWAHVQTSTGWKTMQVWLHTSGQILVRDTTSSGGSYIRLVEFSATYTVWA